MKKLLALVLVASCLLTNLPVQSVSAESKPVFAYNEKNPAKVDFNNLPAFEEGYTPPNLYADTQIPDDSLVMAVPGFVLTLGGKLLSWGATKAFDWANENMFEGVFDGSQQSQIKKILDDQGVIMNQLTQISNEIKQVDYKKQIDDNTRMVNSLNSLAEIKLRAYETSGITEKQRQDIMKSLYDSTGNNFVMNVINYYNNYIEGNGMLNGSIFDVYDLYAHYNFWWEHQGYEFREKLREKDYTNFSYLALIAIYACEAHIEQGTDLAVEAAAAKESILNCLRGDSSHKGLEELYKEKKVVRLPENEYRFVADGKNKVFYIPKQGYTPNLEQFRTHLGEKSSAVREEMSKKLYTDDGVFNVVSRRDLQSILDFYNSKGKATFRDIFGECINIPKDWCGIFDTSPIYSFTVHAYPSFHVFYYTHLLDLDSSKMGHTSPKFIFHYVAPPFTHEVWKIKSVGDYTALAVGIVDDNNQVCYTPSQESNEKLNISGIITDTKDNSFEIGTFLGDSDLEDHTDVEFDEDTIISTGEKLNKDVLDKLKGKTVEIQGTYYFDDEILYAEKITVIDDTKKYTVQGKIKLNGDNSILIEDKDHNSYCFYIEENKDIKDDTEWKIEYSWKNGIKAIEKMTQISKDDNTTATDKSKTNVSNPPTGSNSSDMDISVCIMILFCFSYLCISRKCKKY